MTEIKLRIQDEDIAKMLDEEVKNGGYANRNQLLNEIITLYFSSRSKFFLSALPPVMESICLKMIQNQSKNTEHLIQMNTNLLKKCSKSMDEIRGIFFEDTQK